MELSESKTDLNQLVIFAKVVETHSFTAAGRALGLPKSTVSRKVAQLEERLGVQLMERTTRRLSLTEVGAAFYERCARITAQIEEAEQAVRDMDQEPHGVLRIAAPHELGPAFLSDVITDFLAAYPKVNIELELTGRGVDVIEEDFDLAIRLGPEPTSSAALLSADLGPIHRYLVASPEYLRVHGTPTSPEELEQHDLVLVSHPARNVSLELLGPNNKRAVVRAPARLVVNNTAMLREALIAGLGVGLLPAFKCREDLEAGRLSACLHDWTRTDARLHGVYRTARHLSSKLRTFLGFLGERLDPPGWVASPRENRTGSLGESDRGEWVSQGGTGSL